MVFFKPSEKSVPTINRDPVIHSENVCGVFCVGLQWETMGCQRLGPPEQTAWGNVWSSAFVLRPLREGVSIQWIGYPLLCERCWNPALVRLLTEEISVTHFLLTLEINTIVDFCWGKLAGWAAPREELSLTLYSQQLTHR